MRVYDQSGAIEAMNGLGAESRPFLFVISFDKSRNIVLPEGAIDPEVIRFDFSGAAAKPSGQPPLLEARKVDFSTYREAFDAVQAHIFDGNSFLANLTASTPILNPVDLLQVYDSVNSRYKLWLKDRFVCFSPEPFVEVDEEGILSSFPMKGTVDAALEDAEALLRSDPKERHEHTTVVDLIRNDIGRVAVKVWVERFRYVERIGNSAGGDILQMSSEIRGLLPQGWKETLGSWFFELLPAGSISGAPKVKTLEILRQAERHLHAGGDRGYYTGVCGFFDGKRLQSGVMIRFLEQGGDGTVFKSGGGITYLSDVGKEYGEIHQKVFIPASP